MKNLISFTIVICVAVLLFTFVWTRPNKSKKAIVYTPEELAESLGVSLTPSEPSIPVKNEPLPKIILTEEQIKAFSATPTPTKSKTTSSQATKIDPRIADRKARFQEQYDEIQSEIDALVRQRSQLESEIVKVTPEFEQMIKRISELEGQKFGYQNDIGRLRLQLEDLEKEYNSYHDERDYDKKRREDTDNYDSVKKKWYRIKKVRNLTWMEYQNRKSKIEVDTRYITIQIKKIDDELSILKTKIGTADTDIEGIKIANQNLLLQIETINKQIEDLKAERRRVQERIDSI